LGIVADYGQPLAIRLQRQKDGGLDRIPFYITRRDGLPLTFAGLWERWKDGFLSCAILTTEAGDAIPVSMRQPKSHPYRRR
jgi:putative SOS response-associated peptidase YedK